MCAAILGLFALVIIGALVAGPIGIAIGCVIWLGLIIAAQKKGG